MAKELLKGKRHIVFDWLSNQNSLFNMIMGKDLVFVDSYLADKEFYKKISSSVGLAVYIDDNKRIDYPDGVVFNGTFVAKTLGYPKKSGVRYILGHKYVLLRKEFWDVPVKKVRPVAESFLITFGGEDKENMTPKILKYLAKHFPDMRKTAIIGGGFVNIKQVKSSADRNTELVYSPSSSVIKKNMIEADIAISAGGQTLFELARTGTPAVAIGVADNQMNNLIGCRKFGTAIFAGFINTPGLVNKIGKILFDLSNYKMRAKMAKRGQSIIDGSGAMNTVAKILKYIKEK